MSITTLRNLQVGIVLGSVQTALILTFLLIHLAQVVEQLCPVELAIEFVHLRNLMSQLLHETLGQTPHHIHLLHTSLFLSLTQLQNHVHTLLLCISNEATRVHHHNLTLRVITVMCDMIAIQLQLTNQPFRIHQILRAPQCDNIYRILSQL